MNKTVVLAEWRRATESFGAAESCRRDGFYADSISRTYYVILHAAKAALQLRDITSESHAAVKRLFGLHLVQTGLVEAEWEAYIGIGLDARLTADYGASIHLCKSSGMRGLFFVTVAPAFRLTFRPVVIAAAAPREKHPRRNCHRCELAARTCDHRFSRFASSK
jgi:uncharacterized protein (UPF0332 family)